MTRQDWRLFDWNDIARGRVVLWENYGDCPARMTQPWSQWNANDNSEDLDEVEWYYNPRLMFKHLSLLSAVFWKNFFSMCSAMLLPFILTVAVMLLGIAIFVEICSRISEVIIRRLL